MKKMKIGMFIGLSFVILNIAYTQENNFIGSWRLNFDGDITIFQITPTKIIINEVEREYRIDGNKLISNKIYFVLQDRDTLICFEDDEKIGTARRIGVSNSSQNSSFLGIYFSNGDSLIESIEILDEENIILVDSLMGKSLPGTYKITGNRLIITVGGDSALFEIQNDRSLRGLTYGMTGTFVK